MVKPDSHHAGSVLPLILIFSITAMITVLAFVAGQYMIARPAFISPSELQALLNARSGIWKGLEMLSQPKTDTLARINTLAPDFNNSIFGKPTEAIFPNDNQLVADSSPVTVQPYSSDSFGSCDISLSYLGCFEMLSSKGLFRTRKKNITVKLGGIYPLAQDTVLYLESRLPIQTPVRGKIHYGPSDTANSFRTKDFDQFISALTSEMTDSIDTMKPSLPLLIQHNDEFAKIPDIVRASLFIDGSHFDLSWKSKKKIIVRGDLQITKKVTIEGLTFLVTGETKLFDDTHARDVSLFCQKTISIGDRAVFSGTAITQMNILVFGAASVENKSMILVTRKPTAATKGKKNSGFIKASDKKTAVFSATFTGSSLIDATVVTLNDTLGIKIDKNVIVKGVLRTKGALSLDGKIYGIVHASKIVDGAAAMAGNSFSPISVIKGALLPIEDARKYYFPFFMGKLSILTWQEE
jgi:hypothetical protein